MASALLPYIYHEQQEPGSMLCAQHCLNNLLQSPMWTADDLATMARRLDSMEDAAFEDEARARRGGRSANYDDSGFFSVQVMDAALQELGLRLVRWRSSEMKPFQTRPEEQEAFVLNHDLHWLCLRRFGSSPSFWFNLDSLASSASASSPTHAPSSGPSWIGPMYLGLTLQAAEKEGYSIFTLRPLDPTPIAPEFMHACEADEVARSLVSSFGTSSSQGSGAKRVREDDDDESGNDGCERGDSPGSGGSGGKRPKRVEMSEEEQLRLAIEASLLGEKPCAPRSTSAFSGGVAKGKGGAGPADGKAGASVKGVVMAKGTKEAPMELGFSSEGEPDSPPRAAVPAPPPHASRQADGSAPSAVAKGVTQEADDEDAELAAAIAASLSTPAAVPRPLEALQANGAEAEEDGDWDEPSPEELRRRRLARFA